MGSNLKLINSSNTVIDWSTGHISLDSVQRIEIGKKTKVFSQYKHVADNLCFSIVCRHRTLDLQASTTEIRNKWTESLSHLLEKETIKQPIKKGATVEIRRSERCASPGPASRSGVNLSSPPSMQNVS